MSIPNQAPRTLAFYPLRSIVGACDNAAWQRSRSKNRVVLSEKAQYSASDFALFIAEYITYSLHSPHLLEQRVIAHIQ